MQQIDDFLAKHFMHHLQIDIDLHINNFLTEMEEGLKNPNPQGLLMLPTNIQPSLNIPLNQKVLVIDAGGTNFRTALVHFDNNKQPIVEHFNKSIMPGVENEVSKEQFFNALASKLNDIANESSKIGFCFSYAFVSTKDKDGVILYCSKEIKAPDVNGQQLGSNLTTSLQKIGFNKNYKVVVVNDTVTTLLMGATLKNQYDSYIGFILGTGINSAYEEQNSNIQKEYFGNSSASQLINMESASFKNHHRGEFDKELDNSTKTPGKQTYEKMISGAYYGDLNRLTIDHALKNGLFNEDSKHCITAILPSITTSEVGKFLNNPSNGNVFASLLTQITNDEFNKLFYLLDRLLERQAKLTAICLTATLLKSGKGKNILTPTAIIIDGITFYGLGNLSDRVKNYMTSYLVVNNTRYYQFVKVDNSSMLGAAVAVLTN
jgi:hexokinase